MAQKKQIQETKALRVTAKTAEYFGLIQNHIIVKEGKMMNKPEAFEIYLTECLKRDGVI